jgi:hypothetical protein
VINLISKRPLKAIEQIGKVDYQQHCGVLSTPQTGYDLETIASQGYRWALDNGCFTGYEPKKIPRALERWQGLRGCLFAVLPDVIQNHSETFALSMAWLQTFHKLGYPPAFVIQDGCNVRSVPYPDIACVFIGGSNEYKKSQNVRDICATAKAYGLWIHHGRVGGKKRFRYSCDVLNCDSFDSVGFSIHPPKIRRWIADMKVRQMVLPMFPAQKSA